jgi:hypothetical protein
MLQLEDRQETTTGELYYHKGRVLTLEGLEEHLF